MFFFITLPLLFPDIRHVVNRVVLWDNKKESNFFSFPQYDWQCLFFPMSLVKHFDPDKTIGIPI